MKYYFVTGTSKGIGRALVEELLNREKIMVVGISRNNSLKKPNFRFWKIDLADQQLLQKKLPEIFPKHLPEAEEIVLINNAAILDVAGYAGDSENYEIEKIINVNLLTPILFTNHFIHTYKKEKCKRVIINISSGASRRAVDGWSGYCTTKAGLEMFSQVVAKEQQLRKSGIRIFSIAPGVVDTDMQKQIRNSAENNFSEIAKFVSLKERKQLSLPEEIASKLLKIIENEANYPENILDLRHLS